ncbi:filamentous hemagglutinin N-terminal domain-containing protein [Anabaena lutea]|uniref:Filamentous hemagglutinin N-terminal domain-containing protein n=1 Tax=Anabaena lutea FACHB-196 TaxID=2692881 RepID=A0ABR8FLK9_9NOST|nr:filamentous hemagglutinin N-terminal domain-containing protein [Anabaena lutea]MBD2569799.1 filamentous hemagglutinin N-terminal domain-containing protein [Anabaena lutea FACHB-196]
MIPQLQLHNYQLGIATLFAIGGILTSVNQTVLAQLTPDQTLGQESSIVKPIDAIKDRIEGGATRGINLFHSFQEFNIGENRIVNFANPVGIENILTRVTGGNASNIFGKLGVEGTANLFLINPNGIFFGNNASLDIRGSFTATTADSIKLGENGLFSATNPQSSNLLSIQPGALFTNALRNYQAQINNQGNLTVDEGKDITFFGANVINTGTLTALEGNIQLVGTENLIVRGNLNTNTLLLDTKNLTIAEDNNATIDKTTLEGLSGNTNLIFQAINDITIHPLSGNSLSLADGIGKIIFTADADGNGVGNFQMNTADTIRNNGQSVEIKGVSLNIGNINTSSELGGGNITLTATSGNITTQNLNSYSGSLYGYGTGKNGGAITLTAGGDITTQDLNSYSRSNSGTAGNGGAITLSAGGDITTQDLNSYSFSFVGTAGNGRAITLSAGGNISTQNLNSYSFSDSFVGTARNGGAITLSAGGDISTQNLFSYSSLEDGGAITLTAGGDISTQNLSSNSFSDSLVGTARNGGAITLSAGGDISTQNLFSNSSSDLFEGTGGNGGAITLSAGGDISTQSLDSSSYSFEGTGGNGGTITLSAGGDISTQNLNSFSYSSSGTAGNGGAITLTAGGDIKGIRDEDEKIPVFSSFSVSKTGTSGQSGNVTLAAKNKITNLDILTLSSSSKSGDVQVNGLGDLSLINTDIITSKQVTIDNLFFGKITLDIGKEGQSGNVNITSTGNLTFKDSRIESDTKGSEPAGNVTITSPAIVTFNNSKIASNTSSTGKAGNIQINANNLTLTNASEISASTTGDGKAGDITLNTPSLTVANGGKIFATTTGNGDGGAIAVNAPNRVNLGLGVQDFSPILSVETSGAGKAGDIIINTPHLTVSDTARITATATATATNTQGGGSITLNASKINLAGVVGVFAETQGQAPAGTLKLNPYENQPDLDITLFPNSTISASTIASGNGGDLIITAPENINIVGKGILAVESRGSGDAGSIQITSQNLKITDGVQISASTSGSGQGGNININTNNFTANTGGQLITATSGNAKAGNINLKVKDNITLDGSETGLFANTDTGSTGDSGSIEIDPKTLIIKNGAGIGVNSQGSGEGGDISLQAGTLSLDNQSFITAETVSNQGGNINLDIQDLFLLRNNSRITATAGAGGNEGNGGNIKINSPLIVAFPNENSDITANAFQGNGGKININTNAIFGLELRPQLTPKSDITASSQFGLAGDVQINTPDVDPTSGLIELPGNLVDAESLVGTDICSDKQIAKNNSFVITGKGGVPADSDEYISNSPGLVEWATRSKNQERTPLVMRQQERINNQPQNSTKSVIQQAQGWIISADGQIILTAEAPNVTPQSSGLIPPSCHAASGIAGDR